MVKAADRGGISLRRHTQRAASVVVADQAGQLRSVGGQYEVVAPTGQRLRAVREHVDRHRVEHNDGARCGLGQHGASRDAAIC